MVFITILALTTLAIAGSAAAFSVYGLAQIFTGAFVSVIIMGGALEAGKLVAASFLYRQWKNIGVLMRTYLFTAIIILMAITSMGIFGFLSAGYQQDTLPLKEMESQITLYAEQIREVKSLKSERIKQRARLDSQIDAIPGNHSTNRRKMRVEQSTERTQIDADLKNYALEIQTLVSEQHKVKSKLITQQVHTGPIIYIAKAFGSEVDDSIKWVIFALITVFDPLAVVLTIALNMSILQRNEKKKVETGFREIDALKEKADKLDKQYDDDSAHFLNTMTVVQSEFDQLQESVHSQKAEIERTVQEVTTATKLAYEAIENAKVEIPKAAKSSMSELEEHLAYLNDQQELTSDELAEKERIETLLNRASDKVDILEKIRSGS